MTVQLLAAVPLLAFAAYRVWRIVAVDQITEPIRSRYLFRDGPVWQWVADLVGCPWCLGWWVSGGFVAAYVWGTGVSWWWLVVLWPAVSTGVGIIAHLVDTLGTDG